MTTTWDSMIAGDDAEVSAEIGADRAAYAFHMRAGNVAACVDIENKYGLFGHSPQKVSEILADMAKPEGVAS